MTHPTMQPIHDELARLEDAFRAVAKRACDPDLTMIGGKALKAESKRLIGQMRAARKRAGFASVGDGWVNEVIRRRPEP